MKRLLLLAVFVSLAFLTSCDREEPYEKPEEPDPPKVHDTSLAGSTWEVWGLIDFEDYNVIHELIFTADSVKYTDYDTRDFISKTPKWGFTGTYTYYPPEVMITITSPEHLEGVIGTGAIRKYIDYDGTEKEVITLEIPNGRGGWLFFGRSLSRQ